MNTLRRGRCRESVTPILRYSVRLTLRPSLSSVSVVPTVTYGKAKYRSKGETDLRGKRERERDKRQTGLASQPSQPASQPDIFRVCAQIQHHRHWSLLHVYVPTRLGGTLALPCLRYYSTVPPTSSTRRYFFHSLTHIQASGQAGGF